MLLPQLDYLTIDKCNPLDLVQIETPIGWRYGICGAKDVNDAIPTIHFGEPVDRIAKVAISKLNTERCLRYGGDKDWELRVEGNFVRAGQRDFRPGDLWIGDNGPVLLGRTEAQPGGEPQCGINMRDGRLQTTEYTGLVFDQWAIWLVDRLGQNFRKIFPEGQSTVPKN